MSQTTRNVTSQSKKNESAPNYIGYYKHMVLKLFSGSEDLLAPSLEFKAESFKGNGNIFESPQLFKGGIVTGLSDFQQERLKGFLDQSISDLSQETDEILHQVLATFPSYLEENLKCYCNNKLISSSCPLHNHSRRDVPIPKSQSKLLEYNDMHNFLEEGIHPKEALENRQADIFSKLGKMQQDMEEYLDAIMSKCRPMTCAEKQQLGQRIHKLPAKALDRVVEIIQNKNPDAKHRNNKFDVNLEELDDVALWRLYAYVETVAKANKCSNQRPVG